MGDRMKALMKEFKTFISRGNVMDMAVGVIIGGAFTAIVNSLVNDIMMPLIALVIFIMIKMINAVILRKKEEAVTPVPAARKCPYCMEEISLEASRCPHCTSEL